MTTKSTVSYPTNNTYKGVWLYARANHEATAVQVIHRSTLGQTKFKRDLSLTIILALACIALLVLPLLFLGDGQISWSYAIFGLLAILGGGVAVWFGQQTWAYLQKKRVADRLQAILGQFLDGDYIYFRDLVLPDLHSVGEIDGVLLGPHGALVFQMETQVGEFICEGDTWYKYTGQKQPEPIQKPLGIATVPEIERKRLTDSPTWQVIRATREVKAWLSVRNLPQIIVQPVVVLSKGKLYSSKMPSCPIIELEALQNFMRGNFSPIHNLPETINTGTVEQISLRLQSGS